MKQTKTATTAAGRWPREGKIRYNLAEAKRAVRETIQRWEDDSESGVPRGVSTVAKAWHILAVAGELAWRRHQESPGFDLQYDLERLIAEHINPLHVKDILRLAGFDPPPLMDNLVEHMVIHMIERDAGSHYDQVDGFVDWLISSECTRTLLSDPLAGDLDGLGITKWMDKNLPLEYGDDRTTPLPDYCEGFLNEATEVMDKMTEHLDRFAERLERELERQKATVDKPTGKLEQKDLPVA